MRIRILCGKSMRRRTSCRWQFRWHHYYALIFATQVNILLSPVSASPRSWIVHTSLVFHVWHRPRSLCMKAYIN